MHPAETFELVLGMLVAVLVLHWLAERLRWPPSTALLVGGGALAFVPGVPLVTLNPGAGAGAVPAAAPGRRRLERGGLAFSAPLSATLSLAIGAVIFSTLVVAAVTHLLMPSLP